ncbi:MAG: insulinase family protein [Erysipelotrichales bacterium]|nr:insulinase family protein [Erysipelotrichales bacterium]
MIYKLHKNGSYNIHTIQTDKFKTIKMEIILRNNLRKETIATRTLLFELLLENSKNYKTKRDLILKEEELYNAICYSQSTKLGNEILSSINIEFLNPKFTKENYLKEAIKLPFDLLFNPNVKDNEFDLDTINIIKKRMKAELSSINEDPKKSAIRDALVNMDESSISSVNIIGSEKDIDSITPSSVYQEYEYIINHDYVDIFIIGDFDENKVIDYINKFANFKTLKNHDISLFIDNKTRNKVKETKEKKEVAQSQIVYIYNTVSLTEYERKYSMQLYNMILGGGSLSTKLAQNLREKNSLCYNVQSIYNKYDNLLIITTSVDKANINKTKKLIESSVSDMMKKITDEELVHAVNGCISSINLSLDDQGRIIDNYLFNYMAELDSIDERIDNYKRITTEEVKKLGKKVKLNSIYILEGDNHEEN